MSGSKNPMDCVDTDNFKESMLGVAREHPLDAPESPKEGNNKSVMREKVVTKQQQQQLIEAQTAWFHVFKDMIDCGDIAKIGPYATTVYMVIKAYTNWKTGKAWPGVELIVEKTGISKIQVVRSLKKLEEAGYLVKERVGRHNKYTLREKVSIYKSEDDKRPIAEATWDYLPSNIKSAFAELQNFVVNGDEKGLNIIHIEHLTLNLQQNIECNEVRQNIVHNDSGKKELDEVDWSKIPDTHPVKKAWLARQKNREK